MLISYVIATRASSPKLLALLQDFSDQLAGQNDLEVLVMVNGTEGWGVLEDSPYLDAGPGPIRCHKTDATGAYHARLQSSHFSQSTYLWFLDDDVRLSAAFVARARAFLEKRLVDFGGGPVYLAQTLTLPDWANRLEIYRWLTLDDPQEDYEAVNTQYNASANAFLRRDDLLALEPKVTSVPYELGRKGKSLLSGEDTDMWYRLHCLGRRHANCSQAVVYHDIHLERVTEEWLLQRAEMESISLWCRLRNYGLAKFFLELVRKTPGVVFSSTRYFLTSVILRRKNLAHALHFRERTAFLPYFFKLLLARPLMKADDGA